MTRYIFVSGGVISGLGKGITASSIGLLLSNAGYRVGMMKVDMYLNQDAGTMNPLEHGEVFVTDDGMETDQDLGHYERFLGNGLTRKNYLTAGQVFRSVLEQERNLSFEGKCVESYIHIPREIIRRIKEAGKGKDILIVEFGGTVGEHQNMFFFEALRRMKIAMKERVFLVHVVYVPLPSFLGEMKTKPAQESIISLYSLGLSPDVVICRAPISIDERRREKIALVAALPPERIFSNPDVETIYEVPLVLYKQGMDKVLFELLGERRRKVDLEKYRRLVAEIKRTKKNAPKLKIGIVAKYYQSGQFSLADAYVSVVESIKHAAWSLGREAEIIWINSEKLEKSNHIEEYLGDLAAIIVPGGFGSRGIEGKIKAIQYARENKIPFLGLCYGMQLATVEFARHLLKMKGANSTEVNVKTSYPVIHLMPEQEKKLLEKDYGGTMRLGVWPCRLKKKSLVFKLYQLCHWPRLSKEGVVKERHRHRYEFNNRYRQRFEKEGLILSGTTPDNHLVEIIELPLERHPFFVGVQFHPEFLSRPGRPHPLFWGLVQAAIKQEAK